MRLLSAQFFSSALHLPAHPLHVLSSLPPPQRDTCSCPSVSALEAAREILSHDPRPPPEPPPRTPPCPHNWCQTWMAPVNTWFSSPASAQVIHPTSTTISLALTRRPPRSARAATTSTLPATSLSSAPAPTGFAALSACPACRRGSSAPEVEQQQNLSTDSCRLKPVDGFADRMVDRIDGIFCG